MRETLKIVIVGHVDHGKSTLVGRLFHDTHSLPEGKLESIQQMCLRRGMPFEYSFLMDALQAERDQGITIDTARIWFRTLDRDYVIIDAPGHKEFLKNMISGAANSDAALVLIDAQEGIKEQSRRHGYLLHLLGIDQIIVVVNKMDLVAYDQARYTEIVEQFRHYLSEFGVRPHCAVPISAREGHNITTLSAHMPWYQGPTLLEALGQCAPKAPLTALPLRFPIQDIYKFDERRILVGRVESGVLRKGDKLLFSPSNKIGYVASIESWPAKDPAPSEVRAGQSIGITLEDPLFIERGEVASHPESAPTLAHRVPATIFWLDHTPLKVGARLQMKIHTGEWIVELVEIQRVIAMEDLAPTATLEIGRAQVGEVIMQVRGLAVLDAHAAHPIMGRCVLFKGFRPVGGGIIRQEGLVDQRLPAAAIRSEHVYAEEYAISREARFQLNGHYGGVLWFTGLSGSGKSTLARELEKRLFQKSYQIFVLDGDNIRQGLCRDLGFSPEDRGENIRRVGEVAGLFAKAGMIVITAFISPYELDRQRAQSAASHMFHTIYIKADVPVCEARDPKGLYKKARSGEISDFTGISAPYEAPLFPDLIIDTNAMGIEECVERLIAYVDAHLT